MWYRPVSTTIQVAISMPNDAHHKNSLCSNTWVSERCCWEMTNKPAVPRTSARSQSTMIATAACGGVHQLDLQQHKTDFKWHSAGPNFGTSKKSSLSVQCLPKSVELCFCYSGIIFQHYMYMSLRVETSLLNFYPCRLSNRYSATIRIPWAN